VEGEKKNPHLKKADKSHRDNLNSTTKDRCGGTLGREIHCLPSGSSDQCIARIRYSEVCVQSEEGSPSRKVRGEGDPLKLRVEGSNLGN